MSPPNKSRQKKKTTAEGKENNATTEGGGLLLKEKAKKQVTFNVIAEKKMSGEDKSPASKSADGQSSPPPDDGCILPPPSPDTIFGSIYSNNFHGLEGIGQGAFAQVYKALEVLSTVPYIYREVALKRINLTAIKDKAVLKTTMNEVNLFKKLSHDNIVKCFYSFREHSPVSTNHYLVLVMEYINGGDMETWIHSFPFRLYTNRHGILIPEANIWLIFSQITAAVAYIHSQRVMHRDLKPPNVLMTAYNVVKLADFGLSRLQQADQSGAKTVCGTPYYMAPERMAQASYTYESDIWSLGCILYEMATLKSPFSSERKSAQSLARKIRNADFPPLPQDSYSIQLETLITCCLNSAMARRPPAGEVHRVALTMAQFV